MEVLRLDTRLFVVLRYSQEADEQVICITNVSPNVVPMKLPFDVLKKPAKSSFTELTSGEEMVGEVERSRLRFQIEPYGVYWLE
jgi:hypothetical protein